MIEKRRFWWESVACVSAEREGCRLGGVRVRARFWVGEIVRCGGLRRWRVVGGGGWGVCCW